MDGGEEERQGGCHCGAVRFRVRLQGGLGEGHRCNCSICRMRGAVSLTGRVEDLEVTAGAEHLALYQFGSRVAEHHFCRICGIYTHHRQRSDPSHFAVNAACLDGVSPFDFPEVPVTDGENHPSDGGSDRIVGVLRYEARVAPG